MRLSEHEICRSWYAVNNSALCPGISSSEASLTKHSKCLIEAGENIVEIIEIIERLWNKMFNKTVMSEMQEDLLDLDDLIPF